MKKDVLITLADKKYLDKAKQLFSSVYHNSGWKGDYLLLTNVEKKEELKWFKDKGIIIKRVNRIPSKRYGRLPPTVLLKFYLFTKYFKKWERIVFLDADIIVRTSLDELKNTENLSACVGYERKISYNFGSIPNELRKELLEKFDLNKDGFNCGVMGINTKLIKKESFNILVNLFKKYKNYLKKPEQAILNLYFYEKWKKMPQVYNFYAAKYNLDHKLDLKNINAVNLHFIGKYKPWNKENPCFQEWKNNLFNSKNINLNNRPKCKNYLSESEKENFSKKAYYKKENDFIDKIRSYSISWIKSFFDNLIKSFKIANEDIKKDFKKTKFGILWFFLEPIIITAFIFLALNSRIGINIQNYPLYILSGLIIVRFFSINTRQVINLVNKNNDKIKSRLKKLKEPHLLIEATLIKNLILQSIEITFLIFLIFLLIGKFMGIIFYPIILLAYSIMIYSLSLILISISLYFKDIERFWKIVTRAIPFISPVFYKLDPGSLMEKLSYFNPIYPFLILIRKINMGDYSISIIEIVHPLIITSAFLIIGTVFYNRNKLKLYKEMTKKIIKNNL